MGEFSNTGQFSNTGSVVDVGMESNQVGRRKLQYADHRGAVCVVVPEQPGSRKPRARPRRVGDLLGVLGSTNAAARCASNEAQMQKRSSRAISWSHSRSAYAEQEQCSVVS